MSEQLEKHLILNSNRLRTFEDARLEVVTYVEAKFGVRINDSKPSDTNLRGHSDPVDVDAVNSLSSGKGKGDQVRVMGVVKVASNRLAKQSKSWSKSEGKGKSKENKGKSKGQSKGSKCAKGSCKDKTSKTGI